MKQERQDILELLVSHPDKMMSKEGFFEFIGKHSENQVDSEIDKMLDEDILTIYSFKYLSSSDLPTTYYGFTKKGAKLVQDRNIKSSKKSRSMDKDEMELWKASRPDYPEDVVEILEKSPNNDTDEYKSFIGTNDDGTWYKKQKRGGVD